jgi:ubiquinone/menaquinone biosynthesis C-methylase UbiE
MKDNFSIQAADYAKFRPGYPDGAIDHALSFIKNREFALDVATGNGQVATKLAKYFQTVYATDISEKQLANATVMENILYKNEPAEKTSFGDQMFDLVIVAQAVHWFEFDAFYKEVYRILKPDGIFCVLGYGLFSSNPASDSILSEFYHDIVGPYWDAERKYLDENYITISFPFLEQPSKKFDISYSWSFRQLIGYLETWSATQHYKKKLGRNPIDIIRESLKKSWATSDQKVTFPILMRIGKLKTAL